MSGHMVASWPAKTSPVVPSSENQVAFFEDAAPTVALRLDVDLERGHADHGGLAELAGDQRGVAGAAAAAGQDPRAASMPCTSSGLVSAAP
jgi:hypothetical protein